MGSGGRMIIWWRAGINVGFILLQRIENISGLKTVCKKMNINRKKCNRYQSQNAK